MTPIHGKCYRVDGKLDVGTALAKLTVLVPWLFKDLKRKPPKVRCNESWMRKGPEWHNGPPLCWILERQWRDAMGWRGKPVQSIMTEGRLLLLRGVRNLVNRHHFAHLDNLDTWPEEWDSWGHFDAGTREYERQKRSRR